MLTNRKRIIRIVEEEWGRWIEYGADGDAEEAAAAPRRQPRQSMFPLRGSKSASRSVSAGSAPPLTSANASLRDDESDNDFFSTPEFAAAQFASVLEDAVMELRLLVSCNSALRVSKTLADMAVLVAHKFRVRPPRVEDELARVDPRRLHCDQYKIDKLDADRNLLGEVLEAAYTDLTGNTSYHALVLSNETIITTNNYNKFLVETDAKYKLARRELAKQLRQQRNHIKSVTYDADAAIDTLNTNIEDVGVVGAVRGRYAGGWQRGRAEQHRLALDAAAGALAGAVERHKMAADHEQRVHNEIDLLTKVAIDETLQEIEVWMDKYDRDIEAIDLRIQKKKANYYITLDKKLKIEETVSAHEARIAAWVSFKTERVRSAQHARVMTEAALVVQAWWRGIIVRRELGPFRPKPKEKDAP